MSCAMVSATQSRDLMRTQICARKVWCTYHGPHARDEALAEHGHELCDGLILAEQLCGHGICKGEPHLSATTTTSVRTSGPSGNRGSLDIWESVYLCMYVCMCVCMWMGGGPCLGVPMKPGRCLLVDSRRQAPYTLLSYGLKSSHRCTVYSMIAIASQPRLCAFAQVPNLLVNTQLQKR